MEKKVVVQSLRGGTGILFAVARMFSNRPLGKPAFSKDLNQIL